MLNKKEKKYMLVCLQTYFITAILIINAAKKYGKVIIGLLTDEAISSYKRLPLIPFEERKKIIQSLKNVDR